MIQSEDKRALVQVAHNPIVAFTTLGCPKNEVDTDLMRVAAEAAGYYTREFNSENTTSYDAIVVNTCSFIQEATEASIEAIFDTLALGDVPVVVAGCIVNRYADDLSQEMPEVKAFIKVGDCEALVRILADCLPLKSATPVVRDSLPPRSFEYLRIADGCDRKCSFCTIPSIRGSYTSREPEDILAQAHSLVAAGTRELIVIAQDIGRYGSDLAMPATTATATTSTPLIDLLEQLAAIPHLKRLRLMYLQPEGLTDELLQTMAKHPTIVPYLEIPVQHVAARILKAMGRNPRDVEGFEARLVKARKLMPSLSVRTTLIAGFPGESHQESAQLRNFVERIGFDYVGVFPYSPEEGTRAAKLPDQLDEACRLERAQELRDFADSIGWQRAANRIGDTAEVLIEGYDPVDDVLIGRSSFQTPDIDGIVRVELPDEFKHVNFSSEVEAAADAEDFARKQDILAKYYNRYLRVQFTDAILYDMDAAIVSDSDKDGSEHL